MLDLIFFNHLKMEHLSLQAEQKQVVVDWPTVHGLLAPELAERGQCWVAYLEAFWRRDIDNREGFGREEQWKLALDVS